MVRTERSLDAHSKPSPLARWARGALLALLLVVALAHIASVFTLNVNWDEFALLDRAERSLQTGSVLGGGRPGLGTMVMMPFAAGCRDALRALLRARLLWCAVVLAAAGAYWALLGRMLRTSGNRWSAAATGLGLWVLAPDFLRHSLEVRTDQPAILFGLLGGLGLLASVRRTWWALVGGGLLGIGFLFSQKLLYVAGLVGVLTVGDVLVRSDLDAARELKRAVLALSGMLLVVLGFRGVLDLLSSPPSAILPVSSALNTFAFYGEVVGWRQYRSMLPLLLPQVIVLGVLLIVTIDWARKPGRHGAEILTAWGVLALGVAVAIFHKGRFPYFYLVLGLFPATIGALVTGPMLERLDRSAERVAYLAVVWTPLVLVGFMQTALLTEDTQGRQAEALAFIDRNLALPARGFDSYGILSCRHQPDRFKVRFGEQVRADFTGQEGAANIQDMLREFRTRPVVFMIPPYHPQIYPSAITGFWASHYAPYRAGVWVAGRGLAGPPGFGTTFEALADADYRWLPDSTRSGVPLDVDGRLLDPGDSIRIDAGRHDLALPEGGKGLFVLRLDDPPAPLAMSFFWPF